MLLVLLALPKLLRLEIGDSPPPTKPHPLPPPHSPPHPAKRTTLWEVATSGSITDVKGFVKVDWSPYPH